MSSCSIGTPTLSAANRRALLAATALAGAAAVWLARRVARPVARLQQAVAQLALGANPALLPRTGARERARLAGQLNQMALQVRELRQARTTLLVGVSRDLHTPLARVLDNPLGNALPYAPGLVEVQALRVPGARGPDAAAPRAGVLDCGPGIPPQQLPTVWQPFVRLEACRSVQTGGDSRGVAILRQPAQAQGWATGLTPRNRGGMAVWVDVPQHLPASASGGIGAA